MIRNCFNLPQKFIKAGFLQKQTTFDAKNQTDVIRRWAGHSKWSNIKHVKAFKDQMRSILFQKLSSKISQCVRENGEDPKINWKLKGLLEEARKISMPNSTIENVLKQAKTKQQTKPYWLIYTGSKGFIAGFEVTSTNPKHAEAKLNQYTKRINLKIDKNPRELYEEKGIIISEPLESAKNGYDQAMEDAIEVGIEEVLEDDEKMLIFECHPAKIDIAHKKLLEKGYNIQSASTELEFCNYIDLNEEEVKTIYFVVEILYKNFEDLMRVSTNANNVDNL